MGKQKIIAGTRASILALAQTEIVIRELFKNYDNYEFKIKKIKTSGDKNLNRSLLDESLKDLFVKEIEHALLQNKIDIAVHSMKDMPAEMPAGLQIGAILKREDPRDVLISKSGKKLLDLPANSVIGTSSIRRKVQVELLNKNFIIKEIRGNIHTRIGKLDKGYDAILLACAGLKRAGMENSITEYFDTNIIVPAPCQGMICVQCRDDDENIKHILKKINDDDTFTILKAEREFAKIFEGGCKVPIGAYAEIHKENITLLGAYFKDGVIYKEKTTGRKDSPEECAQKLAELIRKKMR